MIREICINNAYRRYFYCLQILYNFKLSLYYYYNCDYQKGNALNLFHLKMLKVRGNYYEIAQKP